MASKSKNGLAALVGVVAAKILADGLACLAVLADHLRDEGKDREADHCLVRLSAGGDLPESRPGSTKGDRIAGVAFCEGAVAVPGRGFQGGTRYMVKFRTLSGDALVWWT